MEPKREFIEIYDPAFGGIGWDYSAGVFESAEAAIEHVHNSPAYEGRCVRIGRDLYLRRGGRLWKATRAGFTEVKYETADRN